MVNNMVKNMVNNMVDNMDNNVDNNMVNNMDTVITWLFLCILAESKTCASHAFSFISKRSIPLVTHLYNLTADISIYWLPYQVFAHDSSTKQTLTYSKGCSEGDLTAFHRSTFHPAKLAPGHHWKPLVKKTSQRIWLWVGW